MNWFDYLEDAVFGAICIFLGMILMVIIRRHFKEKEIFIHKIPFVRVGTPVMIGDDLYLLTSYEYQDGAGAQEERTVIFKSVPQHSNLYTEEDR